MTTIEAPPASAPERYMTARQVSEIIEATPRWVVEKARTGDLPSHKLPGSNRVRFLISEVQNAMRGD